MNTFTIFVIIVLVLFVASVFVFAHLEKPDRDDPDDFDGASCA